MSRLASRESTFRWRVLIAAALGMMIGVTGIIPYTLGVLVPHLSAEFHWPRAQIGLGQSLQSYGAALVAPAAGWLVDRRGLRVPAALGLAGFAACLVAIASMQGSIAVFWLLMTLVGFSASLCGPLIFTRAVNDHFSRTRGLALGIVLGCVGLGAMLYPMGVSYLSERFGWRMGVVGLAAWVALATPLVITCLGSRHPTLPPRVRPPTTPPGMNFRWRYAVRHPAFWRLAVAFPLSAIALSGYLLHLVPMLRGLGLSAPHSAALQGLIGPAIAASRLVSAPAADYIAAPRLAGLCMSLAAAGALALLFWGASASLVGIPLLGVGFGCEVDLMSYMIAGYFPIEVYGRAYGLIYAASLLAAGTGPLWLGAVFDRTGSYAAGLLISAVSLFIAAAVFFTLPAVPRTAAR